MPTFFSRPEPIPLPSCSAIGSSSPSRAVPPMLPPTSWEDEPSWIRPKVAVALVLRPAASGINPPLRVLDPTGFDPARLPSGTRPPVSDLLMVNKSISCLTKFLSHFHIRKTGFHSSGGAYEQGPPIEVFVQQCHEASTASIASQLN